MASLDAICFAGILLLTSGSTENHFDLFYDARSVILLELLIL